jgi:hypothetical protein
MPSSGSESLSNSTVSFYLSLDKIEFCLVQSSRSYFTGVVVLLASNPRLKEVVGKLLGLLT